MKEAFVRGYKVPENLSGKVDEMVLRGGHDWVILPDHSPRKGRVSHRTRR